MQRPSKGLGAGWSGMKTALTCAALNAVTAMYKNSKESKYTHKFTYGWKHAHAWLLANGGEQHWLGLHKHMGQAVQALSGSN